MTLPPPVTPTEPPRMPWWAVAILLGLALVILGTLGRLAWQLTEQTPIVSVAPSPTTYVSASTDSMIDPALSKALIKAANAQSTWMAPTPEPTQTPIYVALPTIAVNYCGMGTQRGDTCEWANPTPAPPPPLPICITPIPKSECEWRGNISAQPVAVPSSIGLPMR